MIDVWVRAAPRSGQIAAALDLSLRRLGELEAPGFDIAIRLIGGPDHTTREGLRLDQPQRRRISADAKEALASAEHHGKEQYTQFIDQAVLQQGLEQLARALHEQVRRCLALQLPERGNDVLAQ